MPNPKRRHSKARTARRRTGDSLSLPALARCPQCQETRPPHCICPHCGFYGGRQVLDGSDKD